MSSQVEDDDDESEVRHEDNDDESETRQDDDEFSEARPVMVSTAGLTKMI